MTTTLAMKGCATIFVIAPSLGSKQLPAGAAAWILLSNLTVTKIVLPHFSFDNS